MVQRHAPSKAARMEKLSSTQSLRGAVGHVQATSPADQSSGAAPRPYITMFAITQKCGPLVKVCSASGKAWLSIMWELHALSLPGEIISLQLTGGSCHI